MDIKQAVNAGADAYADAETALVKAHDALLRLPATYGAVNSNGSVGYLEATNRSADAMVLAGKIAVVYAEVVSAHRYDTTRADELGIDLPAPRGAQPESGGGGGR